MNSKTGLNIIPDYHDKVPNIILDDLANEFAKKLNDANTSLKFIFTIPAHNEEMVILDLLNSIYDQIPSKEPHEMQSFEVIIFCHKCTDKTFEKCKKFKKVQKISNLYLIESDNIFINNVGAVRRILMNIAYQRLVNKEAYIVMSDADTFIRNDYIFNLSGFINSEFDLICGQINTTFEYEGNAYETILLKNKYNQTRLEIENHLNISTEDPLPAHLDNSGPNMAIRAKTYDEIGGLEPIGFCEDIAFYDTVKWSGYSVLHTSKLVVTTSSRKQTKVPWGFGAELATWDNAEKVVFEVETLDEIFRMAKIMGVLKSSPLKFSSTNLKAIQELTGLKLDFEMLRKQYKSNAGLYHYLRKKLEKDECWRAQFPKRIITEVLPELQHYLTTLN